MKMEQQKGILMGSLIECCWEKKMGAMMDLSWENVMVK